MTSNSLIASLAVLCALVFVAFGLWPEWDIATSAYFFDATGFPVGKNPLIESLRRGLRATTEIAPAVALVVLGLTLWLRRPLMLKAREWGFVLALFLLGPGLLVNGVLKSYWGRARPTEVIDFGGTAQFTPAWQISDQCVDNCSFVSGEGAGTMALTIALLLLLRVQRHRLPGVAFWMGQGAALAMLAFVGWQRIAAGRHFLSDVLLSMLLTLLLAALLARLMLRQDRPRG